MLASLAVLATNAFQLEGIFTFPSDASRSLTIPPTPPPPPNSPTLCDMYSVLKGIVVNDDICREVDALGGIDTITRHLAVETDGVPVTAAQLAGGAADAECDSSDAAARYAAPPGGLQPLTEEAEGGGGEGEGGGGGEGARARRKLQQP